MKGCSRLERLDFVEQTAFNSGYLKVTVSAAGWGCHFMLQDFKWQCQLGEFPNPSLPWWVCTLFVLTPCASASTCGSVLYESWVMWVRNARKHSLPHLRGYFLSTSDQWYRSLRPHTLAEQEWRVGVTERWMFCGMFCGPWGDPSSGCCEVVWFAALLPASLHQNSQWSKTRCEGHCWLAEEVTERVILLHFWNGETIINELFFSMAEHY